jgi:hypothetical protein
MDLTTKVKVSNKGRYQSLVVTIPKQLEISWYTGKKIPNVDSDTRFAKSIYKDLGCTPPERK